MFNIENTVIDTFALLDVILIAIIFSGTIVKVGQGRGTAFWDNHFKGFYFLFALFILENIVITVLADYVFLPFLEQSLPYNFLKLLSLTATLVLACNVWFAWTFGFRRHVWVIIACVILAIITLLAYS